jgi:hypothetical protein
MALIHDLVTVPSSNVGWLYLFLGLVSADSARLSPCKACGEAETTFCWTFRDFPGSERVTRARVG